VAVDILKTNILIILDTICHGGKNPTYIMGLSSFTFLQWAPKDAYFLQYSAYRQFMVIQSLWVWY